ncbi:hypothetical protein NQ176_g4312 [Zarea fungicola]|uniref:Uncharacterized protein n=1 Tax=Zarea fungicola TaxID=93591 RepID=A0ACC1NGA1_9HYPO|nr:hypothetical protein NQ176_g4312 [Lecanicillium fungicola]
MAQLITSPFSFPRKLTLTLLVSGVLAYTLILLCDWNVYFELLHPLSAVNENGRGASELALEADSYLDELIYRHDLSKKIEWAVWNIESTQSQPEWSSVTRVPARFQPRRPRIFDIRSGTPSPAQMYKTIHLPSPEGPRPGQFDASSYVFGVSTTYERLMENDRAMIKSWQWWLTSGKKATNGAHIIVILDRADDHQIKSLETALESLTISATVKNSAESLSAPRRYAQLAGELLAYGSGLSAVGIMKEWFILMDENMFFPCLSLLNEKLATYDTRQSIYIGVPSDADDWLVKDGKLTTTGGGVVVLSHDGLSKLLSLSCAGADGSTESVSHSQQWTAVIHECMTTHGKMSMDVIPGLYTPDTNSELSELGSFETGNRPIVIRNQERGLDLVRAYLIADECGEACFMQRFLFKDNWVLVNGVSISQYQYPVKIQTNQPPTAESNTRRELNSPPQPNDGGMKLQLTGGGPRIVWELMDSSADEQGVVWQAFVKKAVKALKETEAAKDDEKEEMDSVILLIWNGAKRV